MDELPFSVKPEKPVDIREVMALYRETYEGTDFDMSKGVKMARAANRQHPADTVVSPIANPWLTTTLRNTLNTIAPRDGRIPADGGRRLVRLLARDPAPLVASR